MPATDSIQSIRIHKHWTDPTLPYPPEFTEGALPLYTSIVDSIAADTVSPHILTSEQRDLLEVKHMADSIVAAQEYAEAHSGHAEGLSPATLAPTFDRCDAIGLTVAVTLAVAGLCAKSIQRALKSYRTALFSVRRRENAFDDTHKAPLRATIVLALITIIFGGLALYCSGPWSAHPTFGGALCAIGCAAGYYVFLLAAYRVVGYAFGTPSGSSLWNAGYIATMAYTGLTMVVPVLLLLTEPEWRETLLWVCAGAFIAGKLIFIIKGFRIFYNKIRSLLYFILYLCALEIIPVLVLYAVLSYLEGIQTA